MQITELSNNPTEEQLMVLFKEISAKTKVIKTWRRTAGISKKKRRFLHKVMTKKTITMIDEFPSLMGSSKKFNDFFTNSYVTYKKSSNHE